jgi:hypothetical protein
MKVFIHWQIPARELNWEAAASSTSNQAGLAVLQKHNLYTIIVLQTIFRSGVEVCWNQE